MHGHAESFGEGSMVIDFTAPSETPKAVIAMLHDTLAKALAAPILQGQTGLFARAQAAAGRVASRSSARAGRPLSPRAGAAWVNHRSW